LHLLIIALTSGRVLLLNLFLNKAVKELDFETAAILRDEIAVLKQRLEKKE